MNRGNIKRRDYWNAELVELATVIRVVIVLVCPPTVLHVSETVTGALIAGVIATPLTFV